ncbi:hypothetical protein ACA910_003189 [Epithemia clementina (nom. ined.)]
MMLPVRGSRSLAHVAARGGRRHLSTKEPKLHKAKDYWYDLKAKRPIDHDDEHLTFHPPYNRVTIVVLASIMLVGGVGSMQAGYYHQQYKQGFWK